MEKELISGQQRNVGDLGNISAANTSLSLTKPLHSWHTLGNYYKLDNAGLFIALYIPLYERLTVGSIAAAHKAFAMFVTPLALAMLSA